MNNITYFIHEKALKIPDSVALFYKNDRITYAQLDAMIWNGAYQFKQKGVDEGEIVALKIENELKSFVAVLSLARIGATAFTLSENFSNENELLETVDIDIRFHENESDDSFNKIDDQFFTIPSILEYETLMVSNPKAPYRILVGSGTTGNPKLMPISHDVEMGKLDISTQWMSPFAGGRMMSLSNMSFYMTFIMTLRALYNGMSAVLKERDFNPFEMCETYKINLLIGAVVHAHQLIVLIKKHHLKLSSSCHTFYVTGSRVSRQLQQTIVKHLTPNLYIAYGANECGTVSLMKFPALKSTENSVGNVLEGVDVEIVDQDGSPLENGKIGFIRIRSNSVISGYLKDSESTRKSFKSDWFYPRDLGILTPEKELIYYGRLDDMMIFNGINIYPLQIELYLMKHEAVEDAVAFSIKHPVHEDIPVCAVVLKEKKLCSVSELKAYCMGGLGLSAPKEIVILKQLPRNGQGKIIKKEVIQQAITFFHL